MSDVNWTSLSDALVRVERLSADDSGFLSFGASQAGGIFVEKGRLCWVAARGLEQRLRDLLQVLGPEQAFRQHSAECLLELCRDPLPTRWASHSGPGYAPRFTFSAEEVALDAVALQFPAQHAAARAELATLAAKGHRAAAFTCSSERECLLPIASTGGLGVEALRSLGHWASSMPMVSRELAAEPSFSMAATEEGEAALVWWREGLLFAVLCDDRASLAAATAYHLACA